MTEFIDSFIREPRDPRSRLLLIIVGFFMCVIRLASLRFMIDVDGACIDFGKGEFGMSRIILLDEVSSVVVNSVVVGAGVGDLPPTSPGGNPR